MELLVVFTRPLVNACRMCQSSGVTRARWQRVGLQNSDRIQRRSKGYIAPEGEQARPITGFYAELLKKPRSQVQPLTRTAPVPQPAEEPPKSQKEQTLEKAAIIFGSKKALAERRQEIESASRNVAGVLVPPKPEEPDNCCMSGCVNCVWDMYRDEMEEWAEKSAQARRAMQAQREQEKGSGTMVTGQDTPSHVAVSMDDDGGGSETNWNVDVDQDKLFDDIPVGIREFMKTEKKLKQMHKQEAIDAA
ncbi:hypothetical protein IAQ61_002878 [Plenodomus lingam]|uniref:Oxidoreductase-like domain-containing protein n=1 Tax=Leptosphaeria maculans (strain JN3 / isolate v23.1.3 / race Av1-4-5-6-7-8) TaxID=985895 RepID=E5A8F3_LEPMJ|nr:hypothetical protein LEMA_P074870.1 [Plenodomus lingam JN3]KAH9877511.1 hypothetical protein IAQ61_002878 [Plenodomus lingam]CBX99898.1 hypothetical protein LEMA_P074870.1 [Plenodomus lingam JN3]